MLFAVKASRAILLFWMVYIYSLQDSSRIVVEETAIRNSIERATFASKDFLLQKSGSFDNLSSRKIKELLNLKILPFSLLQFKKGSTDTRSPVTGPQKLQVDDVCG